MGRTYIAQAVVPTTDTTLQITATGLSGNPQAAEFFLVRATANDTTTAHRGYCHGATDGTRQWSLSFNSEDAQANSDTTRAVRTDCVVNMTTLGLTTLDGLLQFDNWIEGGVQLSILSSSVFSSAWRLGVVFYQGFDNIRVDTFLMPTIAASPLAVSLGFRPTYVKIDSAKTIAAAPSVSGFQHSVGYALDETPVQNQFFGFRDRNNQTGGQVASQRGNDHSIAVLFTGGTIDGEGDVSFDADGFSFTTTNNPADPSLVTFYIAVDTGSQSVSLIEFSTPTSTGVDVNTTPGFTPSHVEMVSCRQQSLNSGDVNDQSSAVGFHAFNATQSMSISSSSDDGAIPTDTNSYASLDPIAAVDAAGVLEAAATFTSFNADGFSLNWSATHTSAQEWIALAIEADPSASGSVRKKSNYLLLGV